MSLQLFSCFFTANFLTSLSVLSFSLLCFSPPPPALPRLWPARLVGGGGKLANERTVARQSVPCLEAAGGSHSCSIEKQQDIITGAPRQTHTHTDTNPHPTHAHTHARFTHTHARFHKGTQCRLNWILCSEKLTALLFLSTYVSV